MRKFNISMSNENTKVPVSVYAEMTPNPAVLKFVANKRLIQQDSAEFTNIEEAKPSPIATQLFHLPFVKQVFISANYIAITKYDIVEWEDITLEVREMVRDYITSGEPVINETAPENMEAAGSNQSAPGAVPTSTPDSDDWDEMDRKIISLLDEYVTPAVASDGGNIRYLGLDNENNVKVLLQGACSGCPSSTATLKQGIEALLKDALPGQIKGVEAVNG